MRTLIVSDLHLDPIDPARYTAAIKAIEQVSCDQLILAGDVFEAWVGTDGATSADIGFLEHMGRLAASCVLIPGNRDFLLNQDWLSQFGIQYQTHLVTADALVIHGDELCTDDHAYQTFRADVRAPQWQAAFLAKPLDERQAIADGLRAASRETQANRPESIGDAVDQTVDAVMQAHGVDVLIHGHTHRPAIHPLKAGLRAVTSDWTDSGIGIVLEVNDTIRRLESVSLSAKSTVLQAWSNRNGTPEWKRNV